MSTKLAPTDTLGYVARLFEPSDWICFQFIRPNAGGKSDIRSHFETLEKALSDDTLSAIETYQDKGYNAYVGMNAFTPEVNHRREQDIKDIRTVYIEFDENGQRGLDAIAIDGAFGFVPEPHFVLESSPGKFYVIWLVKDFTIERQKALNSALQKRYGSDAASTDATRILRLPGTRNLKPQYNPTPTVRIVQQGSHQARYIPANFEIEIKSEEKKSSTNTADDNLPIPQGQRNKTITSRLGKIHNAAGGASYETLLSAARDINQNCVPPLADSELETIANSVSKYSVKVDTFKEGIELRAQETKQAQQPTVLVDSSTDAPPPEEDENPESSIPAFDASVINGIYANFVELVTRGTTLNKQFAYAIAKTIVGIRMAGKVKFEDLDIESRYYTALIGETGSGKGEAWRRTYQILTVPALVGDCGFKVVNDADSGAGLKDLFFPPPKTPMSDWIPKPVLCFVDEATTLGNKSKDTRNPGILDEMITLANSTSISRTLAARSGGNRTTDQARLAIIMCGQNGEVYMKAFAGRTKLGWYDRLYPEFGAPVEVGDLPAIDNGSAMAVVHKLNMLDYSGTMKMSPEAKALLDDCWNSQSVETKKKARWRSNLKMDAYMSAFGRGLRVVEPEDASVAIKIFERQLVIRRVCFTTEVPDRVGYYLGLIKRITERMVKQLSNGISPEQVAKSRRDYETATNAYRDNEEHIFAKAWETHSKVHLQPVTIRKSNGHDYQKFLPLPQE